MRRLNFLRYLWRSITVGRMFGVPVQIHTTWFVFPCGPLIWACLQDAEIASSICIALLLTLLLFSFLAHEFAHVLAARHCGCVTRRVLVTPIGCIADLDAVPADASEMWIAVVGPLVSLALGILSFLGAAVLTQVDYGFSWYAWHTMRTVGWLNLVMGVFNLLPCFPMDGGRILRSLLAVAIGRLVPGLASRSFLIATRVAVRWVGRPCALAMIAATIFYTHLWHHILLFALLLLAGEVECWLQDESIRYSARPAQLRFLPQTDGLDGPPGNIGSHMNGGRNKLRIRINPEESGMVLPLPLYA
jgi:Zn-dependent protease